MNRCLDIQWGMHMAERDKVCVCVGGRLRGMYSYRMTLWNTQHKTHMNHTLAVHRHRAR